MLELFLPTGRAKRLYYLSISMVWAIGTEFLVLESVDLRAHYSVAIYYASIAGVTSLLAWLQMCATVKRLEDLKWSWLLSLPWVPVTFWPVWRLFIEVPSALALLFGAYAVFSGVMLLLTATPGTANLPITGVAVDALPPRPVPMEPFFDPVVGWLVITNGERRGEQYRLRASTKRVGGEELSDSDGRGSSVSIRYQSHELNYLVEPLEGVVLLNDRELTQAGRLTAYDRLRFGQTTVVFMPLCGPHHNWEVTTFGARAAHA
jgi:uncharacterized membrane protein YhaH (DUF805 family)